LAYKEKPIEKLYYTIGEVADMFNVNTSLIRFWEKEFDIINPKKNAKGNRLFQQKDIETFHLIYHLVKERGMTLKGAASILKDKRDESLKNLEIIKNLKSIKETLISLRDNL
jgi:DNA-binding transcriptional MerR regulator